MQTHHLSPRSKTVTQFGIAGFACLLFAACSDDDDPVIPAPTSTTLSASMNSAQETTATTLGSNVRVTVRNLAPDLGTFQTPVWVGLHDGTFDIYDSGALASAELESLAEDGNFGPLSTAFTASGVGQIDGAVFGAAGPAAGPIAPGESATAVFRVDPTASSPIYMSYASMIIPSNDAFIANADPLAHQVFDGTGTFVPTSITVAAAGARDAGTEFNDESTTNTAFFGQAAPNTGTTTTDNIAVHPGFLATGMGGILDDAMFANADFASTAGYEFLSIEVAEETPADMPTGSSSLTLNAAGDSLAYDITALDLSGPAIGLHLHEGAVGASGAVLVDLMSGITTNTGGIMRATGSVAVTTAQADLIRAGNTYLNLHTTLNPAGEIRGQAVVGEVFDAVIDTAQESPSPILGSEIKVIVQNRAPSLGTFQTPVWTGFHDGTFDIYDLGALASPALESIAEDGNAAALGTDMTTSMAGTVNSTIAGIQTPGPIAPGETTSATFRLDPMDLSNNYLSWASMILPSNDAFIANADPLAHRIFDGSGMFVGMDFVVAAAAARDAGTEFNDESTTNTAFFGQAAPNTGTTTTDNIIAHPGFLATGMGGILDDAMFANADFATTAGYEFLRVFVREGATPTAPTGTASVVLAADGVTATVNVTGINLSGTVTGAHIHAGTVGNNGPVEVSLTSLITRNESGIVVVSGQVTLTPVQATALRNGGLYVNLHTALNPAGEMRGQL